MLTSLILVSSAVIVSKSVNRTANSAAFEGRQQMMEHLASGVDPWLMLVGPQIRELVQEG